MTHIFVRYLNVVAVPVLALFLSTAAQAATTADATVTNCARQHGVIGRYYVKTLKIGRETSQYVSPGGSVNPSLAERINVCIFKKIAASTGRSTAAVNPNPPNVAATCRAEYNQKRRLTRGGQDYESGIGAARLLGRLIGRNNGVDLLNEEYQRCLSQAAYHRSRCKGSIFIGGTGYCVD